MKDGSLGGAPALRQIGPREPAAENDTGGLGLNRDVLAKISPRHLEHSRLAAARSAGEHHQLGLVPSLLATAGMGTYR